MRAKRTILLVVMAIVLITASAGQGRRLRRMNVAGGSVVLHDAPPMIVFTTVVLGGFKGLLADVLWLRASLLQDEGRYLELVQLSDWVTKLEPGLPEVWAFHAWNMSYNLSVMMPKPEDRWRWIQNGISLLRDEGIVYNPGSPKLFFELGWIFEHKMGRTTDMMHLYYKKTWAGMIADVVGQSGYMDYGSVSEDTAATLASQFGMDVDIMKELDDLYGPFDWRLPEANAIYWGYRGVAVAGEKGYVSCDRLIYQSLMQLFRTGNMEFDPARDYYRMSFHPDILPGALKAFTDARARHPDDSTISDSYAIFMREVVRTLHHNGLRKDAKKMFLKLFTECGGPDTVGGYDKFISFKYDDAQQ